MGELFLPSYSLPDGVRPKQYPIRRYYLAALSHLICCFYPYLLKMDSERMGELTFR